MVLEVTNEKELYDAIQINAAHCRLQVLDVTVKYDSCNKLFIVMIIIALEYWLYE